MLTSELIKKEAKAQGADAVGIGSLDRYEGAPRQMDIRQMMPGAKSIVAMAFRHYRGLFRGIEEGTFFTAYSAMGYAG
ncbi:MAG: (4Fe-4S)-binding protein, partial [Lentisphaerae bacterium]|nr:(4Fe-4S)-binding protein [Lentisphaerota bacterium]